MRAWVEWVEWWYECTDSSYLADHATEKTRSSGDEKVGNLVVSDPGAHCRCEDYMTETNETFSKQEWKWIFELVRLENSYKKCITIIIIYVDSWFITSNSVVLWDQRVYRSTPVVDLEEEPGPPPPYFGQKQKTWQKGEKPAGQVNQNWPPLPAP